MNFKSAYEYQVSFNFYLMHNLNVLVVFFSTLYIDVENAQ